MRATGVQLGFTLTLVVISHAALELRAQEMQPMRAPLEYANLERAPIEVETSNGGPRRLDPQDPVAMEVAKFVSEQWASQSNSMETFEPVRIVAGSERKNITPDGKSQFELEVEFKGSMGATKLEHVEASRGADGDVELLAASTRFVIKTREEAQDAQKEEGGAAGGGVPGLSGGFQAPSDPNSPQIRSAAVELARVISHLEEGARLVVCSASQQVVNGINYKLDLGLGGCDDSNTHFKGTVYRSFQGYYQASLQSN